MEFETAKPVGESKIPRLWYEALQRRQAEWEGVRGRVLKELALALEALQKRYSWDEIYLFGSVVRQGRFGPRSDIDIAIRGLNPVDYYAFVGDISERLNRRVDVVRLEECGFSDWILKKGVRWTRKTE